MSSEHEHSATEFARRLVTLTPAATLTRDQILFEAGRNAGRKESRPWRFTASVMTVGMIGLLAVETWNGTTPPMAWRSPPRTAEQQPPFQVAQSNPEPPPSSIVRIASRVESADYIRLRDLVLERGVEALPRMLAASTPKKTEVQQPNDEDGGSAWWRLRIKQMGGASL